MHLFYDAVLPETQAGEIGFSTSVTKKMLPLTQNETLYFRHMPAHYYLPYHEIDIPVVDCTAQGTLNVPGKRVNSLNQ